MPITRFDMENQAIQRQMLAAQETIARELTQIRQALKILGSAVIIAIANNEPDPESHDA